MVTNQTISDKKCVHAENAIIRLFSTIIFWTDVESESKTKFMKWKFDEKWNWMNRFDTAVSTHTFGHGLRVLNNPWNFNFIE